MALSRVFYNTLVDDAGTGTTGTIVNKAFIDAIYDDIDAQLAILTAATVAAGTFTDVPYVAGNFTGSGAMTWVVDIGDVGTHQVCYNQKLMIVNFVLATTSVGGTPSTDLRIAIPGSNLAAKTLIGGTVRVSDNGSAGEHGVVVVAAGGSHIIIRRSPAIAPPNWTASTNNTTVQGFAMFERQ